MLPRVTLVIAMAPNGTKRFSNTHAWPCPAVIVTVTGGGVGRDPGPGPTTCSCPPQLTAVRRQRPSRLRGSRSVTSYLPGWSSIGPDSASAGTPWVVVVAEVVATGSPPPWGRTVKRNVPTAPRVTLDSSRVPGGGLSASLNVHVTVSPATSRIETDAAA